MDRLIALINDLLDLEKLEAGQMPLDMAPASLADVAERSVQAVDAYAQERSVELSCQVDDAVVLADSDRIVQVIVNILANAIRFSPPGGRVLLSSKISASREIIEVRISDQGRGIPEDHQRTIFNRYGQVEREDSKRRAGTGLGLAICKLIVDAHGGEIGVESQVGKGSTFWFRLPWSFAGQEGGQQQTVVDSEAVGRSRTA